MWYVDYNKMKCKNCYACIKVCPVNAIKVENDKASIMEDRCIVCGECYKVCNYITKVIKSEKTKVKKYINAGKTVVASLAPSFAAVYGKDSNKIPTVLKTLGFNYIEETVLGIEPIMDVYSMYASKDDDNNYITSFCPTITSLIEKHYPEVINSIIPAISPYICHSRMLKRKYGNDCKVVFIGPCIAKKTEGQNEESVDAVITFKELDKWIKEEKIEIDKLEDTEFDGISKDKRLFPIVGYATDRIKENNPGRKIFYVNGIEECKKTIEAIKNNKFKNILYEMTACRYGCISGTGMPLDNGCYHERRENLLEYANGVNLNNQDEEKINDLKEYKLDKINVDKTFKNLHKPLAIPSENEITKILNSMGKYRKSDEINCRNCGYSTCREKAMAVYNNMADISMCIPFMRERSEKLTNIIFDSTPNLIVLVNKDLDIIDMNPSAQVFFDLEPGTEKDYPLIMFLKEEDFEKVKSTNKNLIKQKIDIQYNESTVVQSILWSEDNQVFVWIGEDITREIKASEKYQQMKVDAINMAQKVINNQMTVAQEIASLLGETTAETKATLTKLKNLIEEEGVK
ncbi:MAG: [Fe-Fe] hydrogenase large subunit C-terminal domain-containing protein [Peptostreptococcaceae bacterium]